jgi:hypothetical protein
MVPNPAFVPPAQEVAPMEGQNTPGPGGPPTVLDSHVSAAAQDEADSEVGTDSDRESEESKGDRGDSEEAITLEEYWAFRQEAGAEEEADSGEMFSILLSARMECGSVGLSSKAFSPYHTVAVRRGSLSLTARWSPSCGQFLEFRAAVCAKITQFCFGSCLDFAKRVHCHLELLCA